MGEDSESGISKAARSRLRKTLRREATGGWQRVVFAEPGQSDARTEEVHERAHAGPASENELDALVGLAERAAARGRVKQTLIVDTTTRIRIDARYGRGKRQALDAQAITKMMGGKDRALRPDRSGELLRVIGLMNADGTISTKHAKKYKQSTHLLELVRPVWEAIVAAREVDGRAPLRMLDLGCGNGYFTFLLGESLRLRDIPVRILGIDARADVVARCQARAAQLGWDQLEFERATIDTVDPRQALCGNPDVVVALHACDTATDDAIALAVRHEATAILVAPCCQRELADQLGRRAASPAVDVPALTTQGLLRREYGALLTDALRIEALEACGYRVDTVEFVGSEHTAKNLLIRALAGSAGLSRRAADWARLRERCKTLGLAPRILDALD